MSLKFECHTDDNLPEGWRKHQCELCGHFESLILNLWKHKAETREEGFSEDFLLYLLTEQNYELSEKIKRLERGNCKCVNYKCANLKNVKV